MEKIQSFQQMVLEQVDTHANNKKKEPRHRPHTFHNKDLNVK